MDINVLCKEYISILKYLDEEYDQFPSYEGYREMSNLELFMIFVYISKVRPSVIFESGYWKGRSSLIILESLKRLNISCEYYIACIVKNPVVYFDGKYDNFHLIMNDGFEAIKKVSELQTGKDILSLIDGPKFKYYDRCEKIYNVLFDSFNVKVVFQHDIDRKRDEENFVKYYNKKISNQKYELDKISNNFIDKYSKLMDKNKVESQRIGIIRDINLLVDNI
jgi:hypothetical protein